MRRAAHKSLRALGVATVKQIKNHFIRNRYPGLNERLSELREEGVALPARILGAADPAVAARLVAQQAGMREAVLAKAARLESVGWKEYK